MGGNPTIDLNPNHGGVEINAKSILAGEPRVKPEFQLPPPLVRSLPELT